MLVALVAAGFALVATACWALGSLGFLSSSARASAPALPNGYQQQGLRVSGTALVRTAPDLAVVRIGYESRAKGPREAKIKNDAVMKKVLAAIEKQGIAKKDIQTVEYKLFPRWDDRTPSRRVHFWHVLNMVNVRVHEVGKVADVMEAASAAGADKMEEVQFTVESLHQLRGQAREMASKVAREKAQQLADEMGVKLGKAIYINDDTSSHYYDPWSWRHSAPNITAQAMVEVPSDNSEPDSLINAGQVVVQAREEVVFEIK
jgi:uncharacterized protein YggE